MSAKCEMEGCDRISDHPGLHLARCPGIEQSTGRRCTERAGRRHRRHQAFASAWDVIAWHDDQDAGVVSP